MKTTAQSEQVRVARTESGCCGAAPPRAGDDEIARQVTVLSALADPTRMQIVDMLSRSDEALCVCDIMAGFALQQPTISHHLKVLRDAHLVNWEKRGLWVHYSLNRPRLEEIAGYLDAVACSLSTDTVERRDSA